jgi:rubrerythrin
MAPIDLRSLTLQDALDLAISMEQEARERYLSFTTLVGGRYAGDASDMFRLMATYEERHERQLTERRRALFGNAPARITADMLDDVEAPDRGAPRGWM